LNGGAGKKASVAPGFSKKDQAQRISLRGTKASAERV